MRNLEQLILWRRMDLPGHDASSLWATEHGWSLMGTTVFVFEDHPCHLAYEVECDPTWLTRSARVTGWFGRQILDLTIVARPGKRWDFNGIDQPKSAGCLDVDLGFTPATNLIALRRLALDIGQSADAPAAYLQFPELKLERLEQRYHRLNRDLYAYESPTVGYAGNLVVSEVGFVTTYPGLWELEILQ